MEASELIKQRRISKKLSQKELAEMVGVSQVTITRIESGQIKNTSIDIAAKIANALQTDIYSLFLEDFGFSNESEQGNKHAVLSAYVLEVLGEMTLLNTIKENYINSTGKEYVDTVLSHIEESFVTTLRMWQMNNVVSKEDLDKLKRSFPHFLEWQRMIEKSYNEESEMTKQIPRRKR